MTKNTQNIIEELKLAYHSNACSTHYHDAKCPVVRAEYSLRKYIKDTDNKYSNER